MTLLVPNIFVIGIAYISITDSHNIVFWVAWKDAIKHCEALARPINARGEEAKKENLVHNIAIKD